MLIGPLTGSPNLVGLGPLKARPLGDYLCLALEGFCRSVWWISGGYLVDILHTAMLAGDQKTRPPRVLLLRFFDGVDGCGF